MSMNNNNAPKNIGVPSPFGNSMAANVAAHLQSQAQAQQQGGPSFPGQFNLTQLTAAHAQAIAQASKAQAQAQGQAQAHAQFQAHLQAQGISLNQSHPSGVANLGSASPSISGAGNPSAKRLPQKPPMRPPSFSTTNAPSPVRMMELSAARKKKQKLPEKQLHERAAAILPEFSLYTQLLEF